MARTFKSPVFQATVKDANGQKLSFYICAKDSKEAMRDLRILFPVCAGYSERTVSKLV